MRWNLKTRKANEILLSLSLSLSLLFALCFVLASPALAQSGSTNVCGETDVNPGGTITWTSTYPIPISVRPAPGTTWFLGQSQVVIPANGSVTVNVPASATPGIYDLDITFNTSTGGYPCGQQAGQGGGRVKVGGG